MDLDRAYVVNGDDLRIALAELAGKPSTPGDAAEYVLNAAKVPDNVAAIVSREQLAKAVRQCHITHAHGDPKDSRWIAALLLEAVAEGKGDPYTDPDDDVVVDAHIHCDHAPASRAAFELGQADQIVEMLGRLPERHATRVLRWAWDYLTDGDEPPF